MSGISVGVLTCESGCMAESAYIETTLYKWLELSQCSYRCGDCFFPSHHPTSIYRPLSARCQALTEDTGMKGMDSALRAFLA